MSNQDKHLDESGTEGAVKKNPYMNPFPEITEIFANRFDAALDASDKVLTVKLIEEAKQVVSTADFATQTRMYYSIGTAYGDLANMVSVDEREEMQNNQLYYLRKCISQIEAKELNQPEYVPYILGIKLNLYTNYGNALDHMGRKIAAIEQYKKVLGINPDFGMALGNIGITYRHYGMLVYDKSHRDYLHHFAFHYLCAGCEARDPSVYPGAREFFVQSRDGYHPEYIKHVLVPPLDIPQCTFDDEAEHQYRYWALQNGLFLNPLNDLPIAEPYFAVDSLQLPDMLAKLEDKPIFHGMFNQFKQEYIYARYEYYCSLEIPEEPHFADKDTQLLNFADYPQYSIRLERLKCSFRTLYSLLDKIAYFINSYFGLGIKERDVSFHNIWLKEKKGRYGYKYKRTLNHHENFAISSIYWISKDFYKKIGDSPNPQAKRISEIRNALEHKYVKIYWDLLSNVKDREIDNLALYLSESELMDETLGLLKLIREVLICLSLAVKIEEDKKREAMTETDRVLPQIEIMEYNDEWKL
jgi:hypothetical protein